MAPVKGDLLARSDFPIYLVNSLGERHFLVAGGGGSAKTGVANAIVSCKNSNSYYKPEKNCLPIVVVFSRW